MVAFYLPGGLPIYSFAIILGLSAVIGLAWIAWQAPEGDIENRLDAGLWVLVGSLVGGRLIFLLTHASYTPIKLMDIIAIFQGGLSGVGAVVGGAAALLIYSRMRDKAMSLLADALLPLFAAITVGAWLGCWIDGCAYGIDLNTWWGYSAFDEWGRVGVRWPTQFVGVISTLTLFWIIESLPEMVSGAKSALGIFAFSLGVFFLSFFRADPAWVWNDFRLDTVAAIGIASTALLILLLILIFARRRREQFSSA